MWAMGMAIGMAISMAMTVAMAMALVWCIVAAMVVAELLVTGVSRFVTLARQGSWQPDDRPAKLSKAALLNKPVAKHC